MTNNPREINLFYNPESSSDKKTVAHAQGVVPFVNSYSYAKSGKSSTTWRMIIESLGVHPKELLNKAHPYYQDNIRGKEFDDEDWLTILSKNPHLMKAPIAVKGKRAMLCLNPTDIYRL